MVAAAVAAVAAAPACHYVVVGVEDSQGSQGDLLGPSLVELLLLLQIKVKIKIYLHLEAMMLALTLRHEARMRLVLVGMLRHVVHVVHPGTTRS